MRRREFVGLVGSFAVARPLVARAQQSPIPVIGYLSSIGRNDRPELPTAFRQGLSESGFIEGCHVAIEYRFAENSSDRLPALAADLANSSVAAIAATSGGNSIFAAKAATSAIPVVFVTAGDPVQQGYVASLNRPGGNVTGVNWFGTQLAAKGLGMLHELVPKAQTIALLSNPVLPESQRTNRDAEDAARALGIQLSIIPASAKRDRRSLRRVATAPRDRASGWR